MKFLSYQPFRRREWQEHPAFPVRSIKHWREQTGYRSNAPELIIFSVSDDRTTVTPIPPEEWDQWLQPTEQ
jgi:hypothetical protein